MRAAPPRDPRASARIGRCDSAARLGRRVNAVGLMSAACAVPSRVVVVFCGGLGSTTLAYWLASRGARLTLLSVDYGQRHGKELLFARRSAAVLGAAHHVAHLRSAGRLLSGSALTSRVAEVPDGRYADASMRVTVVPTATRSPS